LLLNVFKTKEYVNYLFITYQFIYFNKKNIMEENKENCKTCKGVLNLTQKYLMGLSLYILGSSIYGTVILIQKLISLF
jgi:tRNA splicing ligase